MKKNINFIGVVTNKDWKIVSVAVLLNYIGLFVLPLYKYGTIFTEEYFGWSIILLMFPVSLPFSFLILYITYKIIIYLFKVKMLEERNLREILFLWLLSTIFGVMGWYFGILPLLLFTPIVYFIDVIPN